MEQRKYNKLRKQYPEYVSLEQLTKICRISKRNAKYLVDNGIIPYIDTGKKTWRYKIALDDVIDYLCRREQIGSMIPRGATSPRMSHRKCFAQMVESGSNADIAKYFNHIYADYADVLTAADIVEMTGLEKSTISKLLKDGVIKSIAAHPKYLIPKSYLLEFVATPQFIEYRTNSEQFLRVLGGFEVWRLQQ